LSLTKNWLLGLCLVKESAYPQDGSMEKKLVKGENWLIKDTVWGSQNTECLVVDM